MKITVNGKIAELKDGCTVQQILDEKRLQAWGMAVAVNGSIIHATDWPATTLHEGDEIDLIRHVGGGAV